jgi:hypothetical protein
LVGSTVAEQILHPDQDTLGAKHDHVEAAAFARVACAAGTSPAVAALISYAEAEAHALLTQNIHLLNMMVEVLIEKGTMSGDEVDEVISAGVVARSLEKERQRRADWRQRERNALEFLKAVGEPKPAPAIPADINPQALCRQRSGESGSAGNVCVVAPNRAGRALLRRLRRSGGFYSAVNTSGEYEQKIAQSLRKFYGLFGFRRRNVRLLFVRMPWPIRTKPDAVCPISHALGEQIVR